MFRVSLLFFIVYIGHIGPLTLLQGEKTCSLHIFHCQKLGSQEKSN